MAAILSVLRSTGGKVAALLAVPQSFGDGPRSIRVRGSGQVLQNSRAPVQNHHVDAQKRAVQQIEFPLTLSAADAGLCFSLPRLPQVSEIFPRHSENHEGRGPIVPDT